ncbi:MAG: hypothetical protein SXA11_26475, partial [Cyanobacteriota bacterium]|nr:hypothetical protein [Cyanobacteriota bacterium]
MSAEEFDFQFIPGGEPNGIIDPLGLPQDNNDTDSSPIGAERTALQLDPEAMAFTVDEQGNVIELMSSDDLQPQSSNGGSLFGTAEADSFNVTPVMPGELEVADKIVNFEFAKDAISLPLEGVAASDILDASTSTVIGGQSYRVVRVLSSETGEPIKVVALIEDQTLAGSQVTTPTPTPVPTGFATLPNQLTLFSPIQSTVPAVIDFEPGVPIGSVSPVGVVETTIEIPVFTGGGAAGAPGTPG